MTQELEAREDDLMNDLGVIQVVAHDVEETNELIQTAQDPELALIYRESLEHSLDIYNKLSEEIKTKLEEHIKLCNEHDFPINIGFYRVLKALKDD